MSRALILFAAFALFACGSDTPVPEYPFPSQAPLEETDLAQYVVDDTLESEEEEEWDDGLSDEDLEMEAPDAEQSPEAEPAGDTEPAAETEEGDG